METSISPPSCLTSPLTMVMPRPSPSETESTAPHPSSATSSTTESAVFTETHMFPEVLPVKPCFRALVTSSLTIRPQGTALSTCSLVSSVSTWMPMSLPRPYVDANPPTSSPMYLETSRLEKSAFLYRSSWTQAMAMIRLLLSCNTSTRWGSDALAAWRLMRLAIT